MAADCCFVCPTCSSPFGTMSDLESHMAEHLLPPATTPDHIATHGIEEHDVSQHSPSSSGSLDGSQEADDDYDMLKPGFNCRHCHASFDDQQQLTGHYQLAHLDKPHYSCAVCHLIFGVKRELSTHMRIHNGEEPHKCGQCGKEFGTKQLLKKHGMWHNGERTHVCKHCNKAFFQKGHLTQHLMIHSGGRPHQCNLCQKTFIFKFDLNRHMKIHAERGFSCQLCGMSYKKQSSLDEHQIKCKGRVKESVSPQPVVPNVTNPLLNLTPDQFKLAQNMLAQQQHALSALFQPPPSPFYCTLCKQHFPSHQLFTIHLYSAHVQHLQPKIVEEMVPLTLPPLPLLSNIKMEDAVGVLNTSTTSISSAASSPQKPSPLSDMSESTAECFAPRAECTDCEQHRTKASDLERELREKATQLQQFKEMMKVISNFLNQTSGENNIYLVREIFTQLNNHLVTSE